MRPTTFDSGGPVDYTSVVTHFEAAGALWRASLALAARPDGGNALGILFESTRVASRFYPFVGAESSELADVERLGTGCLAELLRRAAPPGQLRVMRVSAGWDAGVGKVA
jgi:hypothetical protein